MQRLMHTLAMGLLIALVGPALAAPPATKDEAMAMVKGAIASIKKDGPDAAYAEISNKSGKFVDRDLYVVVYRLDGHVLAHGANEKLIGTDQSNAKDVDGKAFVQERIVLAHKQPTFWQEYKFKNPVTQQTERKQTYCERYEDTAVCAGVYGF
jgi:signal transduction histidine kinase